MQNNRLYFYNQEVIFRFMVGYLLKKVFANVWNNIVPFFIFNIFSILFGIIFLYNFYLFGQNAVVFLFLLFVLMFIYTIYDSGQFNAIYEWTQGRRGSINELFIGCKRNFRHAVFLYILRVLMLILVSYIIPSAKSLGGIMLIPAFVLSWVVIFVSMALNYYMPLYQEVSSDNSFVTTKKSFIVLFDNFGFSFILALLNTVFSILSLVTLGLIPGASFLQLLNMEATEILMLKYDYLKNHPEARNRKISMSELIAYEIDKENYL